ncbi:MAG: sigma 54-interacting transcriptional regulator [Planctomycetota bacterium]|nr:sigma 54-interacting transcriptional regulator [Planctomycetota bacterium]
MRDYLKHPVGSKEFVLAVERCMQSSDDGSPRCGVEAKPAQNGERSRLIGCSQPMVELREQIENAARCSSTVLITGETGTGKQLVAESVHQQSVRRSRPLVSINCAVIPDSLLESELFGFEKGAFTGAHERREGKLRQAHGGTILLDEIGDMSLSAQAKLLGFLEDRRVCCLGGSSAVLTDVRVVAATNQDLEEAVLRQAFRRDLFYRLNVVRIRIPPLRERREDLPLLIDHLLQEFSKKFGRTVRAFGSDSTDLVMRHDWPGNVRELRNLIEAVFVNRPPAVVTAADLPRHVLNSFERRDSAGRGDRTRCADQGPGGDELE